MSKLDFFCGRLLVFTALRNGTDNQTRKDQAYSHPLLRQQSIAVPYNRQQDVEEFPSRADQGVGQTTKGTNGEEDEKLPNRST